MAEVAQFHEALLADVESTITGPGLAAFWWLGQHSFIVKIAGKRIYIDPYFAASSARQTPPLLRMDELGNADIALVTHDHGDHLCPESLSNLATNSPSARFVGPRATTERMINGSTIPSERFDPI